MFHSYSHYNKDFPGCKRSEFPFFTDFRKSLSTFILTNPLKRSTLDITCIVNFLSIYSGGYYRERIQQLDVENEIAVLTISRPAALNALNSETLDELNTALTEIEGRDDIKVVILTGGPDKKDNAFKSFVAGADIAEMVNFTAPEARAFGIRASVPFFKLMNMRQVTIAAVNGFALGGGCEIAMACDIRIASDNAIFGQPECGLGIIPGFGGTQRLARLVGMGRAKEMIFTCDNIDAAEAYRIGLVNKVVAKEELMETAKTMAAKIISKGSYAVSVAKAAINNGYDMDIKNAVEMEANLFGVVNDTHDKKEGMGAFLEKRKADLTDF